MLRWHALHQIMPNDGGNAAPVARKGIHEARSGLAGRYSGNPLESTAQRLDKDRSVRSKPRLFRADLSVEVLPYIKIFRLEQPEIKQTPSLVSDPTEDIVLVHRGINLWRQRDLILEGPRDRTG